MLQEKFNEIVTKQITKCNEMLAYKKDEYAALGEDRLAHFKKAAVVMNSTPKAALMGMLSKHLVSVSDMCTDDKSYLEEQWEEKITDSINYLLILRALVEEEKHEED